MSEFEITVLTLVLGVFVGVPSGQLVFLGVTERSKGFFAGGVCYFVVGTAAIVWLAMQWGAPQ